MTQSEQAVNVPDVQVAHFLVRSVRLSTSSFQKYAFALSELSTVGITLPAWDTFEGVFSCSKRHYSCYRSPSLSNYRFSRRWVSVCVKSQMNGSSSPCRGDVTETRRLHRTISGYFFFPWRVKCVRPSMCKCQCFACLIFILTLLQVVPAFQHALIPGVLVPLVRNYTLYYISVDGRVYFIGIILVVSFHTIGVLDSIQRTWYNVFHSLNSNGLKRPFQVYHGNLLWYT